jgi:hypothetical protein
MAPLPPISPPSDFDLTQEQKDRLQRLWKCHHRELIDVKTSAEAKATPVPTPSYRFVVRLHAFLVAFLQSALDASTRPLTDEGTRLVRDAQHSCLKPYAKFALSPSASNRNSTVRLVEGRRVIALHHEDFLSELNHFELKGQSAPQEFIRRESFGAYLYHMPSDALAALGCAMALAITTLWRQQTQGAHSDATKATSALQKLDRFVDATQIVVRFAHVEPQVNMMDVKTGLVGKFVTIKGHVVKARPKRLRVATADFSCQKCGTLVTHCFESGRYSVPTKCVTPQCRSKAFSMIRPTARYINVQDLRLQEAQEESTVHAGRTPRQIEVELAHDLVDSCRPGDSILVAASVAAINTAYAAGTTSQSFTCCSLLLLSSPSIHS